MKIKKISRNKFIILISEIHRFYAKLLRDSTVLGGPVTRIDTVDIDLDNLKKFSNIINNYINYLERNKP